MKISQGSIRDLLKDRNATLVVGAVARRSLVRLDAVLLGQTELRPITSLEANALDQLMADPGTGDVVIGCGGGQAIDGAKHIADLTDRPFIAVPSQLSCLSPFTDQIARRSRRELRPRQGRLAEEIVIDHELLDLVPAHRNRSGAAAILATMTARADWALAHNKGKAETPSKPLLTLGDRLVSELDNASAEILAGTPEGRMALVDVLSSLGESVTKVGHRRLVEGSEHVFVQAWEHRFGTASDFGGLLAAATTAMAVLQGDEETADRVIALANACGIVSHPDSIGLDEGVFNGVLRHTFRFAHGEDLPHSVLSTTEVSSDDAAAMWKRLWELPKAVEPEPVSED